MPNQRRTPSALIGMLVLFSLVVGVLGGVQLVSADVSSGDRATFFPIAPCRLVDTRPSFNVGPQLGPIGADETLTFQAHGSNGNCTGASAIPTDATGLSLNVTSIRPTLPTFLTVWGEGSRPVTSNLNPLPGQQATPNAVNTPLSPTGSFNVYNLQGQVEIAIDINGYYAPHNHDDRYVKLDSLGASGFIAGGTVDGSTVIGFNGPDGVTASSNRLGIGNYVLTLEGLSAPLAPIVQITPFGSNSDEARACSLGAISGGTTVTVPVNCFGEEVGTIVSKDAAFQFIIVG